MDTEITGQHDEKRRQNSLVVLVDTHGKPPSAGLFRISSALVVALVGRPVLLVVRVVVAAPTLLEV